MVFGIAASLVVIIFAMWIGYGICYYGHKNQDVVGDILIVDDPADENPSMFMEIYKGKLNEIQPGKTVSFKVTTQ